MEEVSVREVLQKYSELFAGESARYADQICLLQAGMDKLAARNKELEETLSKSAARIVELEKASIEPP